MRNSDWEGFVVVSFSPVGCPLGKPDCPYLKGLKGFPCGVFNFKDKESVCCYCDDKNVYHRCCWLPSDVKDGFRVVKFYAGRLHGDFPF
jgi:hypothetical protein